jgi:hypothetical protein
MKQTPVRVNDFGWDHWTLWLKHVSVDEISQRRRIPICILRSELRKNWKPIFWSTRLAGFFRNKDMTNINAKRIARGHDDVDCFRDFEAAGLITHLRVTNVYVEYADTYLSLRVDQAIRQWIRNDNPIAFFYREVRKHWETWKEESENASTELRRMRQTGSSSKEDAVPAEETKAVVQET